MTAATFTHVLSDEERGGCLRWLATGWDERPASLRKYLLAQWAHPSLSDQQRDEAWALYLDSLMRESALRAGVADWTEECPHLRPESGDCLDMAIEHFDDLAREALARLIHGEQE